MINFEYLKSLTKYEMAEFLNKEHPEWCGGDSSDYCEGFNTCVECCLNWLNQEHIEPMPKLKTGMFVEVRYSHEDDDDYRAKPRCEKIGLVANGIIVYQSGGFDFLNNDEEDDDVMEDEIMAVYCTYGFDNCNEHTCIWRRNN